MSLLDSSADHLYEDNSVAESQDIFSFKPEIYKIEPNFSSFSGYLRVSIIGVNLDIGSKISVNLSNIACSDISVSNEVINCYTGKHPSVDSSMVPPGPVIININIDDEELVAGFEFEYRSDPMPMSIQPGTITASKSILLTIVDENFHSFYEPVIKVSFPYTSLSSECSVSNSTYMLYWSPVFPSDFVLTETHFEAECFISSSGSRLAHLPLIVTYLSDRNFLKNLGAWTISSALLCLTIFVFTMWKIRLSKKRASDEPNDTEGKC